MKIAILGGDGFVGWPTTLHLSAQGHEIHIVDNLSRRWIDTELGVQSLTPMDSIQERCRIWREVSGAIDPFPPSRSRRRLRAAEGLARRGTPRRHRPSGRAARRALFNEIRPPQGLHGPEQHDRHPQPPGRDGGDRDRRPPRASRNDGRLRLFRGRRADPGGLSRHRDRHAVGQEGAGDPVSHPARLGLSHDQVARSDPLPVLRPERRPQDHRPASGDRLGHPHRGDPRFTTSW